MTFLPADVVAKLKLKFATGKSYKLRAYDGRFSEAQAVQADMLFLGRTFKGRYLVRDSEMGILGRDVLNHFAILLDGPRLIWHEQPNPLQ